MATLDAAYNAALDVRNASFPGYPNHDVPSIKYALWAAALSTNRDLERNGNMVNQLRPYVDHFPLDRQPANVLSIIKQGSQFCCLADAVHIKWVEWAYDQGLLTPFTRKPEDYAGWLQWRKQLYGVANGHGFAWKTLSFAGLLMWPLDCPLVPVDRHVMARLGLPGDHSPSSWKQYAPIEQQVVAEWLAAGQPYTVGIWHWFKWSEYRQQVGAEDTGDTCESHQLLSPYAY